MSIYVAKTFTATATGQRLKDVTCEKCGTKFHYMLSRTGAGSASAPYYLFQNAARKRADAAAQKSLTKMLERDEEMVPCPSCLWVNESAIQRYRLTKYGNWTIGVWIIIGVTLFIDFIMYINYEDMFRREPRIFSGPILTITLIGFFIAATLVGMRRWMRNGYNPNKNQINGRPNVPPGTPPALIANGTGTETTPVLTAIPSVAPDSQLNSEWVTYRADQRYLPPLCCECLGPPDTVYGLPITLGKVEPIPMCKACRRRIGRRWWLYLAIMFPLSLIIAGGLSLSARGIDEFGRVMSTILVGGVFLLIGVGIIEALLQPYAFKLVDRERDVWKAKFRNRAYTALIQRQVGETDGVFRNNNNLSNG